MRVEGGGLGGRGVVWGRSIRVSRDRREERGAGDGPSSTLIRVQLHPGWEIRVKIEVGDAQARTQARVCARLVQGSGEGWGGGGRDEVRIVQRGSESYTVNFYCAGVWGEQLASVCLHKCVRGLCVHTQGA